MYRVGWQTDRTLECRAQDDRCSSFRAPHLADCLSSGPGVRCFFSAFCVAPGRYCQVRCLRFDPSLALAPSSCVASVDMYFYCKCGLRPVILEFGIVRVVYALEFLLSTVHILRRSTLSRWSSFAESFAHHFWRKTNLLHAHV